MDISFDSIIHHALSTRFVVMRPIYQDEKEEIESTDQPAKGWPHIRPGFVFTPESITFEETPGDLLEGIGFTVSVTVPRRWIHYGWMEAGSDRDSDPDLSDVWDISCLDLVEKCDEAPNQH